LRAPHILKDVKKGITIRITGKVQGVFFRAFTKEKADELDIAGFVRNESNGDVYIEAEGEEELLTAFTNWCKQGPRLAIVTGSTTADAPLKNFRDFIISR